MCFSWFVCCGCLCNHLVIDDDDDDDDYDDYDYDDYDYDYNVWVLMINTWWRCRLDVRLYKFCHQDAVRHCHAPKQWHTHQQQSPESSAPSLGHLVFACLYRSITDIVVDETRPGLQQDMSQVLLSAHNFCCPAQVLVPGGPDVGYRAKRIDPIPFLAVCCKRRLNQAVSVLSVFLY